MIAELPKNTVYRSVERKAHGLVPMLWYDWLLIVSIALASVLVHPLALPFGVGSAVGVTVVGRRLSHGRREWLELLVRRRRDYYRAIEPDVGFVPYRDGAKGSP